MLEILRVLRALRMTDQDARQMTSDQTDIWRAAAALCVALALRQIEIRLTAAAPKGSSPKSLQPACHSTRQ